MKKIITLILFLLCFTAFGQNNFKVIFSKVTENVNQDKLYETTKNLGYKGGESIRVFAKFAVNWKGEIVDVSARAPHKIFEDEVIRLIKAIPQFGPPKNLKEGQKMKFTLPVNLVLETDSERKRRLKKEARLKRKQKKEKS